MSFLPKVYLASQSPQRRHLLAQLNIPFAILNNTVPEIPLPAETPHAFTQRVALAKAQAGWQSSERQYNCPVIGADTIVTLNNQILGKPADRAEGIAMLTQLAGKTHQVLSAVAIVWAEQILQQLSISEVTFRALTITEVEHYWETGESLDKAGAYAIQGLGATFISQLNGSYSGVMGLPLFETAHLLNQVGITVLA